MLQNVMIIVGEMLKSKWFATMKEKAETLTPFTKLITSICFPESEKIRAVAAGKINKAVIKKTPTMRTDKAMVSESKIRKTRFQNSIFIFSILAKSSLILMRRFFLKAIKL